jgi:hypothetical protein
MDDGDGVVDRDRGRGVAVADPEVRLDPEISPDQLFEFYERNNICEVVSAATWLPGCSRHLESSWLPSTTSGW